MFKLPDPKKVFSLIALAATLVAPVAVAAQANKDNYASGPGDYFYLNGPLANSTVSGTIITSWRVSDNDQANVPYELTLRDRNCNALYGNISAGSTPSSSGTDATVQWPSAGPLIDKASVPDGMYCMQLCVSLKNGAASYSACALRQINIRNTNIPPQISSNPPADRTINASEGWAYQVQASDANGDALTFSLLNNPGFLSINTNTGYIYTNSAGKNPATYDITVVVKDAFGGTASQAFQLTVVADPVVNPAPTPTPSPTPTPTPAPPPSTGNQPATINITFPVATSELKGASNQVSWTASDDDGIKKIDLAYSTDKTSWLPIASLSGDKRNYIWDVSKLTDGEYYLQITVTDNKDAATTAISQKFSVANNAVVVPPSATKPLIINVKPEDGTSITQVKPDISGEFTPPAGGAMDTSTLVVKLDDVDISSTCTATATDFKCAVATDLSLGLHKVHVEVKSTDDQVAMRDWSFTVIAQPVVTPPAIDEGSQISSQTIVIVLSLCFLLLLLLLIPWLLYRVWKRHRDQEETTVTTVNPAEYTNYNDYLTASSQPAALPEITTNYYTPVAPSSPDFVEAAPIDLDISPSASQPVAAPAAPAVDPNSYVTTPDFMSYYSAPSTGGVDTSDSNVPDWLKAPDAETTTNPVPVIVPAAPAAQPQASEPIPAASELTPTLISSPANQPQPVSQPQPAATPVNFSPEPTLPADEYVSPLAPAAVSEAQVLPENDYVSTYNPLAPAATLPEANNQPPVALNTGDPLASAVPMANNESSSVTPTIDPVTNSPSDNGGSYGYGQQVDNF